MKGSLLFLCPSAGEKEGIYTFSALAAVSYPFVDLPDGNTLRCKLILSGKFAIYVHQNLHQNSCTNLKKVIV